ncbi:MAG: hypothetical protein ACFHWX_13945 [Bacteroidota bacterium]
MQFTSKTIDDKKILIVNFLGETKAESVARVALEYREYAAKKGCSIVLDFTEAVNKISVNEGLRLAKQYNGKAFEKLVKIPITIVANNFDYIFFKVIEQFVSNQGVQIKTFRQMNQAIAWLDC